MSASRLRTGLGVLGAVVVLGTLFSLVGVEEFLRELAGADTGIVLLVVVATVGWLATWGWGLRTIFAVLDIEASFGTSFLLVNGAMFLNNVTPFGQAGGEPVTALLISRATGTEYERGLAAIASMDAINFLPSITLALLGAGYYATQTTLNRRLRIAVIGAVALAVLIPGVGYLVWRYQSELRARVVGALSPVLERLSNAVPGVVPLTRERIADRVDEFVDAIERVATDRTGVVRVLVASTLGWLAQMIALWLAFVALGSPIPFSVLLFVVPVGAIAAITPTPGGTGGIEAVLVGLLSSLPGVAVGMETVLTAVVIFRGAVYWIPVTIGGIATSVIGVDAR